MNMKYFSDKEGVNLGKTSYNITTDIWNGIAAIVNAIIRNNHLSKAFPKQCPDGNGICGFDMQSFCVAAIAVIPGMKNYLPKYDEDIQYLASTDCNDSFFEESKVETKKEIDQFTYDVLDFIEFTYQHINDVRNGDYHEYFKHYELTFLDTTVAKERFILEINEIFERNHIGYKLCGEGNIQHIVDDVLLPSLIIPVKDSVLEELIQNAANKFKNPKISERRIALEKLWDAFERIKTIEISEKNRKKQSLEILLSKVSNNHSPFRDTLVEECKKLTEIGNNFQIRHFEKYIPQITSESHIDYLFYRMYSLISLLINTLQSC